ncbi:MAG: Na(+)-translocating NADH-quinone reductase subunit C [Gammaproteobacteria bacterium]|nr:Na(+)-translocating NADH-quinone reductase subunit C [Gammaproteobacteria bacterium]
MASKDSIKQTLIVSLVLCLVCSVVVSTAAVILKPIQQANKNLDMQAKILATVDLLDKKTDIQTQFKRYIETRVIELESGRFVEDIDAATYDQRKAAKDPATSVELNPEQDFANIKRRAKYATVYLVKQNDVLQYVVLPVHGYGLWSTMYGFIALKSDLNTLYGLNFYEHAETPGLGGEIENPAWQALWKDKQLYSSDRAAQPALEVIKGKASGTDVIHQIDGIAGATLTSRGVSNMIEFWFSEQGFQHFINRLKSQG